MKISDLELPSPKENLISVFGNILDTILGEYSIWQAERSDEGEIIAVKKIYSSASYEYDDSEEARFNYVLRKALTTNPFSRWLTTRNEIVFPISKEEVLVIAHDGKNHELNSNQLQVLLGSETVTEVVSDLTLHRALTQEIFRLNEDEEPFVFGLIDIDDFEKINIDFGIANGDLVLEYFNKYLKGKLGTHDRVIQMDGNRYAVIINGKSDLDSLNLLFEDLLHSIHKIFNIEGHYLDIKFSAGFVMVSIPCVTATEILKSADTLLYQVKDSGKNGYIFQLIESPLDVA